MRKISWTRVLFSTQVLSVLLFFIAGYFCLKQLKKIETCEVSTTNQSTKTNVVQQVQLSNEDDCADIVITTICKDGKCENFVNAFHVICKTEQL